MERPLTITVDGPGPYDPAAGETICSIPTKKGVELLISKRAVGETASGEMTPAEVGMVAGGGFELLGGPVFLAGEIYFVYDAGVKYATQEGSYTNGFNLTRVMAALVGRLGWRAGTLEGSIAPNATNATSRSGRYFNDFNPICTLRNVAMLIEDPEATAEQFNDRLLQIQESAIITSLRGVVNVPELLERGLDFERYLEQNDRTVENAGLFVGRRIRISRLHELAVQIDSVCLSFDSDVTFPLYLFQEGKKAPLWTGEVTAIAEEATLVELPELILSYLGSNHLGGRYYFGYFQEDLGAAKAIDQSRHCPSMANHWEIEFIESAKTPGELNFSRQVVSGSPWSHGLNLQLSAFKDWTHWIVAKPGLFDELIGLQVAADIVQLALTTIRSNPEERILKEQLQAQGLWMQLEGVVPGAPDSPKTIGLRQRIAREVAAVRKTLIPNHRGIKYSGYDCQ